MELERIDSYFSLIQASSGALSSQVAVGAEGFGRAPLEFQDHGQAHAGLDVAGIGRQCVGELVGGGAEFLARQENVAERRLFLVQRALR